MHFAVNAPIVHCSPGSSSPAPRTGLFATQNEMRLLLVASACCVSLLCLQVLQTSAQGTPAAGICGIAGYDLGSLANSDHWLIRGAKDNCIVDDYDDESVDYCEYYIAVCRSLPDNYTSGVANVSVVEKVYLTNGTTYFFTLGKYNTESGGHNPTSLTYNGFYTQWKGGDQTFCNNTEPKVTIIFQCDGSAAWEKTNPNVTQFKISIIKNPLDQCLYAITVRYSGACYIQPTLAPSNCQLDEYDIKSLSQIPYWIAKVPAVACYDSDKMGYIGCVMSFALCRALPPNITEACQDSAICQTGELETGEVSYSMGRFFNYTLFKKNDNDEREGFHVDFYNGTITDECKTGLLTRIIFICNSSAIWDPETADVSQYTRVSETDSCSYMITLQYEGACSGAIIVTGREGTSFVGWIIMALFFVAVLTYLGVGAAYQYFAVGARGLQILPHYDFWSTIPVYIIEGCKYCLDIITCFKFDGSTKKVVEYDRI